MLPPEVCLLYKLCENSQAPERNEQLKTHQDTNNCLPLTTSKDPNSQKSVSRWLILT